MKHLITLILLTLLLSGSVEAQQKVSFSLANYRISGGFFMYDLKATVPAGQSWHVGSCNIRVNFTPTPAGSLTVKADNPVQNANTNISGANGYQAMTTTSVNGGVALGLNILTFNTSGFYTFAPGVYTLGTMRWNIVGSCTNAAMLFRVTPETFPSVVYDSLTQLTYSTNFGVVNPTITSNMLITNEVPTEFKIYQNYPNPFNPTTSIRYDIAESGIVKVKVYDISGKEVADLVNGELEPGRYETSFDAASFASGVYFCRIETKDFTNTIRMLLIK